MAHQSPTESAHTAKQLVFLAMMAIIAAVIVFLCGVLVGRGVPLQGGGVATFGDARPGGTDPRAIGGLEDPAAPGEEVVSPLRNLSYFDRLNGVEPEPVPDTLGVPAPAGAGTGTGADTEPGVVATGVDERSFVVQVTALPEASAAADVAARLVASGYPAFVVAPEAGAPAGTYRVRVGPYADRGEVDAVRRRLETEERFETWIIQR